MLIVGLESSKADLAAFEKILETVWNTHRKRNEMQHSMKPDDKLTPAQQESMRLSGLDPTVQWMLEHGIPVTRKNFLIHAGLEEPLEAEHEAMVEEALANAWMPPIPCAPWPSENETPESELELGRMRLSQARHRSKNFRDQSLALSKQRSEKSDPSAPSIPDSSSS